MPANILAEDAFLAVTAEDKSTVFRKFTLYFRDQERFSNPKRHAKICIYLIASFNTQSLPTVFIIATSLDPLKQF